MDDSLFMLRWLLGHSLSGVSPGMRQVFESPCPSKSPVRSVANAAAASPTSPAPHPHIPDDTSAPSFLPANSRAILLFLPGSARRSAQSRRNNPLWRSPHVPPAPSRPAPEVSVLSPVRLASSPLRHAVPRLRKALPVRWKLRAQSSPRRSRAAFQAATQFQTIPAACAHACVRPDASVGSLRRAPFESVRPTPAPLLLLRGPAWPFAKAGSPGFPALSPSSSPGFQLAFARRRAHRRSSSSVRRPLTPATFLLTRPL